MKFYRRRRENAWRGLAAGAAGGLIASGVMSLFHSVWAKVVHPPAREGPDSTVRTANAISDAVVHHELTLEQQKVAGPAVHYLFGTMVGAVYGSCAGRVPAVSAAVGLPFGAAVWLGADMAAVPALGLSGSPVQRPLADTVGEFAAHLVYGAVTDVVRRGIQKLF